MVAHPENLPALTGQVYENIQKYIKRVFRSLPTEPDPNNPAIEETNCISLVGHDEIASVQFHKIYLDKDRGYWGMEMRHHVEEVAESEQETEVAITWLQFPFPQRKARPTSFFTEICDFEGNFLREIGARGGGYELLMSVIDRLHSQNSTQFPSLATIFVSARSEVSHHRPIWKPLDSQNNESAQEA